MSQAVGTVPEAPGKLPVAGPWLTGSHGANTAANGPWKVYGKTTDITAPSPSKLWIFLDEDSSSINDAGFAVSCQTSELIDWPATYHNDACGFAFADGHSEVHKWLDPRTKVVKGNVARRTMTGSQDVLWLQERTSARK